MYLFMCFPFIYSLTQTPSLTHLIFSKFCCESGFPLCHAGFLELSQDSLAWVSVWMSWSFCHTGKDCSRIIVYTVCTILQFTLSVGTAYGFWKKSYFYNWLPHLSARPAACIEKKQQTSRYKELSCEGKTLRGRSSQIHSQNFSFSFILPLGIAHWI